MHGKWKGRKICSVMNTFLTTNFHSGWIGTLYIVCIKLLEKMNIWRENSMLEGWLFLDLTYLGVKNFFWNENSLGELNSSKHSLFSLNCTGFKAVCHSFSIFCNMIGRDPKVKPTTPPSNQFTDKNILVDWSALLFVHSKLTW